jgi:hypothetical protein
MKIIKMSYFYFSDVQKQPKQPFFELLFQPADQNTSKTPKTTILPKTVIFRAVLFGTPPYSLAHALIRTPAVPEI